MKQTHFLSLLLCSALLSGVVAGCSKTEEQPIVRKKDGPDTTHYVEAAALSENIPRNALSERLHAPKTYETSIANENGTFELTCHADVKIPDVAKVPVYKVSPRPFDQEWIDQVTKAFFGDAPVYDGDSYFQTTKADVLEHLNELKTYQAEGNLDPYGLIASAKEAGAEYPEDIYSLQGEIDSCEAAYHNAPDAIEKIEVTPVLSEETESSNYFTGAVELDGCIYRYRLRETFSSPMDIKISRVTADRSGSDEWNAFMYFGENEDGTYSNPDIPERDKAEEMAGITPEQAVEMTDQYMKKLGLTDFSAKNTILSLYISGGIYLVPYSDLSYSDAAYMVSYTRDIQGFPITDEFAPGGETASENASWLWNYEKIYFYVNDEGLQEVQIMNLYQLDEIQVENVELLSFPEIADIFETMVSVKYEDHITPGGYARPEITDVNLGYMRIYDPNTDSACGLLVPVWDFFGVDEWLTVYDGRDSYYKSRSPINSLLTINAADGSVLNRNLGY